MNRAFNAPLRGWKPRKQLPLPAPDDEFWEIETATEVKKSLEEWYAIPAWYRWRQVAHVIERDLRDSYNMEMGGESGKEKKPIDKHFGF